MANEKAGASPAKPQAAPAAPAAKVKAPKKELTPDQLKLKEAMDKARAEFNKAVGKVAKPRAASTQTGGFTGTERLTVFNAEGTGFSKDPDKALAKKIGNGLPLSEAYKLEGIDWPWVRYRLVRGSVKLNGMSIAEAFAKASGK